MAWYVELSGRQVWVDANETVYTVTTATAELPVENLTYLVTSSKKAVYTEHAAMDDFDLKQKKKEKDGAAGRARGFIVMVENVEGCSVNTNFHAAARKMLDDKVVSRIDTEEAPNERRRKKRGAKKVEDPEAEEPETQILHIDLAALGENEVRVETMARCTHPAHGPGFRLEVGEGGQRQVLHMFTAKQELALADWLGHISSAIKSQGWKEMDSRVAVALLPTLPAEGGAVGAARKNEAQAETAEDDWLSSMMGLGGGAAPRAAPPAVAEGEQHQDDGVERRETVRVETEAGLFSSATVTVEKTLPPWLQKKAKPRRPTREKEAE